MSIKIKFVTDYVCPYCLVAKVPLMEAVSGKDVEIEWVPYELTPQSEPGIDTYHDEARREKWKKTLIPVVEKLGLKMKIPPKVIPRPHTRLAFEGWHFAVDHGCGEAYNNRMYEAYFMDELNIEDMDVLCHIAREVGLDGDEFRKALENGSYAQKQAQCNAYARNVLQVKAVPTIFIEGTKVEGGIYTKEGFEEIIEKAITETEKLQISGMSCGLDGHCG